MTIGSKVSKVVLENKEKQRKGREDGIMACCSEDGQMELVIRKNLHTNTIIKHVQKRATSTTESRYAIAPVYVIRGIVY